MTPTRDAGAVTGSTHILVDAPELADGLDEGRRWQAVDELIADTLEVPPGWWVPPRAMTGGREAIGLPLLGGVLVRRAALGGRSAAELVEPGDLISVPEIDADGATGDGAAWRALLPCRLALLDSDFTAATTRR